MRAAGGHSVGGAPRPRSGWRRAGGPHRAPAVLCEALRRQQSARPANAARVFETTGPGVPGGSPVA